MEEKIKIQLMFLSGIDREIGLVDHNQSTGLKLRVAPGTRLKSALKQLGYRPKSHHSFFCAGERITVRKKLKDGDQIACVSASAGG